MSNALEEKKNSSIHLIFSKKKKRLHTKVMEFSESISHDQWENVHVVIMGSHMARKGFLISQYFAKLFGIREDDDRKLIFAEGNFEEGFALDLLVII